MGKRLKYWLIKVRHRIHRMLHFEYWPIFVFYAPFIPVWMYYAFRSRNPFYFTAVNPGIKNGGFFNNSKNDILLQIPKKWTPKTKLVTPGEKVNFESFQFPLVIKPDNGLRGKGVHIIKDASAFQESLKVDYPVLIQEYIDLPLEFGVFYYRNGLTGESGISGVTGKQFLTVVGNGQHTLGELLRRKPRASSQLNEYKNNLVHQWEEVLPAGEQVVIEKIGNHNRGTLFYDASYLINSEMISLFEKVAGNIDGFYWGRFDIKVASIQDLYNGEHLKVLEVNGSQSEPTHVYDPRYSLFKAYCVVLRHIRMNYKVARSLVRQGLSNYPNAIEFIQELRMHIEHEAKLQKRLKTQS